MIELQITSNAAELGAAFAKTPEAVAESLRDVLSEGGGASISGTGADLLATMTGTRLAGRLVKDKRGRFVVLPRVRGPRPVVGFLPPDGDGDILQRVAAALDKRMAAAGLPLEGR